MSLTIVERVKLVFVRPKLHDLPMPKTNDGEELREYFRRNEDYKTARLAEPQVLAHRLLAELAKTDRVNRSAVWRLWPRKDHPDWPDAEPKWPDGWCCFAMLFMSVNGWHGYCSEDSWFAERGSYMCANRLTYEELKKTDHKVTDGNAPASIAAMARNLCCVVEHAESVEGGDFGKPVWWMPDGSRVEDAEDFKSAVEDNIAAALLKRAIMGLDEQTRPDEP